MRIPPPPHSLLETFPTLEDDEKESSSSDWRASRVSFEELKEPRHVEVMDLDPTEKSILNSDFVHRRKEHYSMKEAIQLAKQLLSNDES
jgi:hypothetical protein